MTFLIGVAATVALFVSLFLSGNTSVGVFGNAHAILLVFGGTAAIFFLSTPMHDLRAMLRSLRSTEFSEDDPSLVTKELESVLAEGVEPALRSRFGLVRHAGRLWAEGISPEMFDPRLRLFDEASGRDTLVLPSALRSLAKYPPALGMIGTVFGLVDLFGKLGADGSTIGPSLALAMTATFYGLILANFVFLPLADRLVARQSRQAKLQRVLLRGLSLVNAGEPPHLVEDGSDAAA